MRALPKLITVLGPTASGKSSLGIKLADYFDGEIVSADSRQVYKNLDIGSGKITKEEQAAVPHHLIDIAEPMDDFSVSKFQKLAFKKIDDIHLRNKLPFIVGGTALYIYAVIDNYTLVAVAPNPKLRKQLEQLSIVELRTQLLSKEPEAEELLSKDDFQNPRRLIRAIEKLESGAPLEQKKGLKKYENLILGIDIPQKELYKKIDSRVDERIKQGMVEEVKKLRENGVTDVWLLNLGLEYKFITEYVLGMWKSQEDMISHLKSAIHQFSRRQMTWFKRDKRIKWITSQEQAQARIQKFL